MVSRRAAYVIYACVGAGFALTPAARAAIVTNGDFATGDFTGWTLFTTSNGSLGPAGSGLPAVTSFNVTGSGAQNAATFNVGEVLFDSTQQGGGITQTVTLPGGLISFSANIAAQGGSGPNAEGGVFNVLLDGITEDTLDIGPINPNPAIIRDTLSFTTAETAGAHTLEILITRPFLNSVGAEVTPDQFITNIAITGAAPVPAPLIGHGLPIGLAVGVVLFGAKLLERSKKKSVVRLESRGWLWLGA
jgi:hypothetical protein